MSPGGISSVVLGYLRQSQFVLGFDREQTYVSERRRFIKRAYCVFNICICIRSVCAESGRGPASDSCGIARE